MKNISELEKQLEHQLRRKLYSSRKLYSNRRAMKKMIRRQEKRLASKIALLTLKSETGSIISECNSWFEDDFERFLHGV